MRTPVLDLFRPAVRLGARLYFRLGLEGVEHIPGSGPVIIAPNHVTYADPPLVTIPIRRPVYYMAWNALFRVPVFASFIRLLRAFPVDVDVPDRGATREAVRLLQAGHALMIFPEAGRSHDGRLGAFRTGTFRLACSLGVPVLPVTIVGGHECWPPDRLLPRPGRVTIVYHPPVPPPAGGALRDAARTLMRQVREAVASRLPGSDRPGHEEGAGTG